MTTRYVPTSDNKYVQYRLMVQTFSTNEAYWQGVDSTVTNNSKNLATSGAVYDFINRGFTFLGDATPDLVPSNAIGKVFYLASVAGTYTNFTNNGTPLTLALGEVAILYRETVNWFKRPMNMASKETWSNTGMLAGYTAGNETVKTITCINYAISEKIRLQVYFANANTADDVKLNINNTGAKALFYNNTRVSSSNSFPAGVEVDIVYNAYADGGNGGYYATLIPFVVGVEGTGTRNVMNQKKVTELFNTTNENVSKNAHQIGVNYNDIINAERNIGKFNLVWEYGSLEDYNTDSTYHADRRIRINKNYPLYLKPGDKIWLSSYNSSTGGGFNLFYKDTDGNIGSTGGKYQEFTIEVEGWYRILLYHPADASPISSIDELANLFRMRVNDSYVQEIEDDVNKLNGSVFPIPDYYQENNYLSDKMADIMDKNEFTNGVSFAFVTDMHFLDNAKNSKYLLDYILKNTNVPFVLSGGDYVQSWGAADRVRWAEDILVDYQNYIGKDKWFDIRGNHDFTIKFEQSGTSGAPNTGYTAQTPEVYNFLMRNQERFIPSANAGNMYYFLDIPSQKTRIFMLNSSVGQTSDQTASWGITNVPSQNEIDWLLTNMQNVTGYRFIFISHIPCDEYIYSYDGNQAIFEDIFVALKNKTTLDSTRGSLTAQADFTLSTNAAICWIGGHNHRDMSHRNQGFLNITTTSDAAYNDDGWGEVPGQEQTAIGSITEQAIDVFHINFDSMTIKTTRIGRGMDRSWNIDGSDTGRNDGTERTLEQMWHGENVPDE